ASTNPNRAKVTNPEATRKSKPSALKAAPITKPATAKASKYTSSQQPKPKPAPAKPQEKKRKLSVDEGIPENEPRFDDEEADMQRSVEESLKDVHAAHQGPLPPVVFREPDSRRRQPLPEVYGKGKEKTHTSITAEPTGPSIHHQDEKATIADVETDTKELLIPTENSGEEVSNTLVLGTESGGEDDKHGGP
ncbi:hypothetical protein Tco_0160649, partial [Tanacetum coccineum]